jgi:hypothetical protein
MATSVSEVSILWSGLIDNVRIRTGSVCDGPMMKYGLILFLKITFLKKKLFFLVMNLNLKRFFNSSINFFYLLYGRILFLKIKKNYFQIIFIINMCSLV